MKGDVITDCVHHHCEGCDHIDHDVFLFGQSYRLQVRDADGYVVRCERVPPHDVKLADLQTDEGLALQALAEGRQH